MCKKLFCIIISFILILSTASLPTYAVTETINMSNFKIGDIEYANGIFVAVGADTTNNNSGVILYSTDGINWTKADTPVAYKYHMHNQAITYHSAMGKFLVVRADGDNKNLGLASSDGVNWKDVDYGFQVYALVYDGHRLLANHSSKSKLLYNSASTTFPIEWDMRDVTSLSGSNITGTTGRHIFSNGSLESPSVIYTTESTTANHGLFSKDFGATRTKGATTQATLNPRRMDFVYLDNMFYTIVSNNSVGTRKFWATKDDTTTASVSVLNSNIPAKQHLTTIELGGTTILAGDAIGKLHRFEKTGFNGANAPTTITGSNTALISDIAYGNGKYVVGTDTGMLVLNENDNGYQVITTVNPPIIEGDDETPKVFDLSNPIYGIVGDGVTDDGPKFRALLESKKLINATINFEAGKKYYLGDYATRFETILLKNAKNVVFNGNGAEILVHPNNFFISIRDSENVTIKDLDIDYKQLPFTQGVVTAKNADGTFTWTIDAGYPDPAGYFDHGSFVTAETGAYTSSWVYVDSVTLISPGVYKVTPRSDMASVVTDSVTVGEKFWCYNWYYATSAERDARFVKENGSFVSIPVSSIYLRNSHNCGLININHYSSPRMTVRFDGCDDLLIKNFNIIKKPGTNRIAASNSDGFHGRTKSGPIIENCTIEALGDDSISISDIGYDIKSVIASNKFDLLYRDSVWFPAWLKVGDELVFYTKSTKKELKRATITAVNTNDRVATVTLSEDVIISGELSDVRVQIVPVKPIVIRNNEFKSQLKEAILITGWAEIYGNTIKDTTIGIHLEQYADKTYIANNTITDVKLDMINVSRNMSGGEIIVEDNNLATSTNATGNNMVISGFDKVLLRGNTSQNKVNMSNSYNNTIISNSQAVAVVGNTFIDGATTKKGYGLKLVSNSTDKDIVEDNTFTGYSAGKDVLRERQAGNSKVTDNILIFDNINRTMVNFGSPLKMMLFNRTIENSKLKSMDLKTINLLKWHTQNAAEKTKFIWDENLMNYTKITN